MSPEAKEDRCAEVQKQIHHLEQEIATNTVECKRHFIKSAAYNHQYLDLRKRIGDTAQPLILDTSNETQLQQITTLITLDTGRARAFSAATKGLRRELQIVQELKALFLEMAELKGAIGTPEYQEALDDILDKVEKQKETRRILGRKLLKWLPNRAGVETACNRTTTHRFPKFTGVLNTKNVLAQYRVNLFL